MASTTSRSASRRTSSSTTPRRRPAGHSRGARAGRHVVGRPDPEGHATPGSASAAPLRSRVETVLFNVLVGDRTGKSITYRVALEVTTGGVEDTGARSLAKWALVVAIAAAWDRARNRVLRALPLAAASASVAGRCYLQEPCCSSSSSSTTISAAPRTSSAMTSEGSRWSSTRRFASSSTSMRRRGRRPDRARARDAHARRPRLGSRPLRAGARRAGRDPRARRGRVPA